MVKDNSFDENGRVVVPASGQQSADLSLIRLNMAIGTYSWQQKKQLMAASIRNPIGYEGIGPSNKIDFFDVFWGFFLYASHYWDLTPRFQALKQEIMDIAYPTDLRPRHLAVISACMQHEDWNLQHSQIQPKGNMAMLEDLIRRDDYVHGFGDDLPMRTIRKPSDVDTMAERRGGAALGSRNLRSMIDNRFTNRPGSPPSPPPSAPSPPPVPPATGSNTGENLQGAEIITSWSENEGPESPPDGTPAVSEDLPSVANSNGEEVGSIRDLVDGVTRSDIIAGMQATERERVAYEEEAKGAVKLPSSAKPAKSVPTIPQENKVVDNDAEPSEDTIIPEDRVQNEPDDTD
jgi:hypothetical protein